MPIVVHVPLQIAASATSAVDREIALALLVATAASGLGALLTSAIAYYVYREAKGIRRLEWSARAIEHWQSFNALIIDSGNADRWFQIRSGAVDWHSVTQDDLTLIYSFLNILFFEFHSRHTLIIQEPTAERSVSHNVSYLKFIWPKLLEHLKTENWPQDFLSAADEMMHRSTKPPTSFPTLFIR